jgi:hypothetical protein
VSSTTWSKLRGRAARKKRFQLREREFDGVEVRTVGRQKAYARAHAFDRGLDFGLFVHREVVEHHDITATQRRDEDLFDIGEERRVIDRAIEHGRGGEPVDAQARHDRVRLPMPVRRVISEAHASRTAPVATQEIGRDPGFVDEDVRPRVV